MQAGVIAGAISAGVVVVCRMKGLRVCVCVSMYKGELTYIYV